MRAEAVLPRSQSSAGATLHQCFLRKWNISVFSVLYPRPPVSLSKVCIYPGVQEEWRTIRNQCQTSNPMWPHRATGLCSWPITLTPLSQVARWCWGRGSFITIGCLAQGLIPQACLAPPGGWPGFSQETQPPTSPFEEGNLADSQYNHIILPKSSGSKGEGSPKGLWELWLPPLLHPNLGLGKIGEQRPVDFSITKWAKNLSRKQESGRREFVGFFVCLFVWFIFISWRLITLQYYGGFCHTLTWIAMDLGFPILKPPPTSLPILSLWVIPVHQPWAFVTCIQPGLAICFTLDNIHVLMLFSQIIPPLPSPIESKSLFCTSVSLFLSCI